MHSGTAAHANPFTGKTAEIPRPARDQPAWQTKVEELLNEAQRLWDEAAARDQALAPFQDEIANRVSAGLLNSSKRSESIAAIDQRRFEVEEDILKREAATESTPKKSRRWVA